MHYDTNVSHSWRVCSLYTSCRVVDLTTVQLLLFLSCCEVLSILDDHSHDCDSF